MIHEEMSTNLALEIAKEVIGVWAIVQINHTFGRKQFVIGKCKEIGKTEVLGQSYDNWESALIKANIRPSREQFIAAKNRCVANHIFKPKQKELFV